jgi:hypothetical protein
MNAPNRKRHRNLGWPAFLVLVITAIALLGYSISLRYNLILGSPLWMDEGFHALAYLKADSTWNISERLVTHSQPALDYVLRRTIWSLLLPLTVPGIRIPSMFFSLLHIAIVAIGLIDFRRRTGRMSLDLLDWALLLLSAIIWMGFNPVEILHSAQARHYSLVSLASTVWGLVCICRCFDSALNRFMSRLILINCHFFSFPIVIAEQLIRAVFDLRQRISPWRELCAGAGAGLLTLYFNWPTFAPFWQTFSERTNKTLASMLHLAGALERSSAAQMMWLTNSWRMTLRAYACGGLSSGMLLVAILFLIERVWRIRTISKLRTEYTILFLVLTHFFEMLLILNRTSYQLVDRHLVVFSGLSVAIWITTLGILSDCLRRRSGASSFAVLALLTSLFSTYFRWDRIEAVVSESNLAYDTRLEDIMLTLHDLERPILYIVSPCWTHGSVEFYLDYLPATRLPDNSLNILFKAATGFGYCRDFDIESDAGIRSEVDKFFSQHTNPIVVFNEMHSRCPKEGRHSISTGSASVQFASDRYGCFWIVNGVRSRAEVEEVQRAINFPTVQTGDPVPQ